MLLLYSHVHDTILQHLLYERFARHLAKCRPIQKKVGFSQKAYKNLGTGYICADSVTGPFVDTARTTTPLTSFEEKGITYLATTNAGWLPYLADEGIRFVHYPANRLKRQFELDQDIPDDLSSLMESPTSIRSFLRYDAFEFWSKCFTAVTIPGSQRKDICTLAMHGYWQAMMTSFEQELMGSRVFLLFLLTGLMQSFQPTLGCFSPLNLCWHMLGSRATLPSLNGWRRIRGGYGMPVIIPLVGRRK